MCRKSICLILFVLAVVTAAGQAEITPITDIVITRVDNPGAAPNFWLESITVGGYTVTVDQLVTGVSTGVSTASQPAPYNEITNADSFDLNSFAARADEVPPTHQIKELGGKSAWLNTNGDNPDFFVFETGGNQDINIEAILPGGIIGQSVNVPQSTFGDTGLVVTSTTSSHDGQTIEGVAFAITDLLDQNGNNLTNSSIIEGIQISSPGYDPSGFYAVASAEPWLASAPSPADGATDVPPDVSVGWKPGIYAPPINGHKVYLSENFNDVNDGIGGITQDANSYARPQRLDFSTTYYWRVDEVNSPPDYTVYEGRVWSFTTEPIAYAIENITATACSTDQEGMDPENTINGSGLDANDLHSTEATDMWLSGDEPNGAWIEYELDKVYKLHEMRVWNSNQTMESIIGFGFRDVTIEYSTNGTDYTTLGTTHEFVQAPGAPDYAHNTTVDFSGVAAKYVRLTANSSWVGLTDKYGLSEVRFFNIPVYAREPSPDSGATDVSIGTIDEPIDVTLGFRAGREADKHDVYFSTDEQAVADGNALVATVTETSYGPLSLDLGKTYYWKINEVNEAETPTTWQGELWNFRTPKYFVVDDFEDYNDYEPDEIWRTWVDGYGIATNGSTAGYPEPLDFLAGEHYVETTIVRSGQQSMPYFYDNSGPANYSEATFTLSSQQDWTIRGIEALSLRFRGNPAGFVEGPAGTYTMTASGVDIWDEADEFRYAYKQLSGDGSIVAQVLSVQNTNGWAKAGVMIRETLDPGSKHAFVCITPGSGKSFQNRKQTNQSSSNSSTSGFAAPYWVKLVRQGNQFTAYHSEDGVNWVLQAANSETANPETVSMTTNVYIGLALTSHNSGVTCVAEFSDVLTTGAVSGVFTQQAIGVDMPTNDPAPMYVAVANSGGTPAVVHHDDDPNATQVSTWTEWSINLTEFSNQGVVLTNVNSISIGFGDKANPQPGGTGVVYFDDIRLYPYRAPPEEIWLEAEAADSITSPMKVYDDPLASGGQYIGTDDGIGEDNDAVLPDGVATYNFTVAGGTYKILGLVKPNQGNSFWFRITTAISQTHEDPDQPGTGWVRWNDIEAGADWHWDEVHSSDHGNAIVNWMLPAGAHTLEIARREDGGLLDAILITDDVD